MGAETLTNQSLDLSRSSKVFFELKDVLGVEAARIKAAEVVTQDLFSLNWENSETLKPYTYSNFIVGDFLDHKKLVYEKDIELDIDVEERVDPLFRRGMEAKQVSKMKQIVLNMPEDTTLIYSSPKRDLKETETECCYPDSFIIAMYKRGNQVFCRQFKSQYIDTKGAGQVVNSLSGQEVIKDPSDIDQVILGMGVVDGFLADQVIQQEMKQVSEKVLKDNWALVEDEVFIRCREGGRKFVQAIEGGQKDLGKVFEGLLWDTAAPYVAKISSGTYINNGYMMPVFQFKTSCGIVVGGGREMGFGMNFAPISFGINKVSEKGVCQGCKKEKEAKELGGCGFCKNCET